MFARRFLFTCSTRLSINAFSLSSYLKLSFENHAHRSLSVLHCRLITKQTYTKSSQQVFQFARSKKLWPLKQKDVLFKEEPQFIQSIFIYSINCSFGNCLTPIMYCHHCNHFSIFTDRVPGSVSKYLYAEHIKQRKKQYSAKY